jgi:2-phosphosulfolactate phosphatase
VKVATFFTAAEVDPAKVQKGTAVVIDVIRATSTIVEALANGAQAVYPTLSTEEAIRLANSLGREDTILCGERRGLKIEGFDLGNSPREFTPDRIRGKRLVMSTTNGTRAFLAAQAAERVMAGSFLNLSGVTRALEGEERLTLVCAGKDDRFSLDDALCAGRILRSVVEENGVDPELDDASRAVLALARGLEPDEEFLQATAAGAALVAVGLGDDLSVCAQMDRHSVVPEMHDRMIRLPGKDSQT